MKALKIVAFWVVVALMLATFTGVALWSGQLLPDGLFGQRGALSNGFVWLLSFAGVVILVIQFVHSRKAK